MIENNNLKEWLKSFAFKQKRDLDFFRKLLSLSRVSNRDFLELQARLYERRKLHARLRNQVNLIQSKGEFALYQDEIQEILAREREIREVIKELRHKLHSRLKAMRSKSLQRKVIKNYLKNR